MVDGWRRVMLFGVTGVFRFRVVRFRISWVFRFWIRRFRVAGVTGVGRFVVTGVFRLRVRRFRIRMFGVRRFRVSRFVVAGIGGFFRVFGFTLVLDIGHISVLVSFVVDSLKSSIGQVDVVGTRHRVAVTDLFVAEVVVGLFVFDGITERVRPLLLLSQFRSFNYIVIDYIRQF